MTRWGKLKTSTSPFRPSCLIYLAAVTLRKYRYCKSNRLQKVALTETYIMQNAKRQAMQNIDKNIRKSRLSRSRNARVGGFLCHEVAICSSIFQRHSFL